MVKKSMLIIISFFLFYSSCSLKKEPPETFTSEIARIKSTWAPDKRTAVFTINYDYQDGKWQISGETSVEQAKKAVNQLVKATFSDSEVDLDFRILPLEEFGDTTAALVNVSVGNLRRTPKYSAELVDQVLMGMKLTLLKTKSYWYLVQTPYNYLGWITRGTITRKSNEEIAQWGKSEKYTLSINFDHVFSEPSDKSQVVSDLVLGSTFIKKSQKGHLTEVELPDGRTGYVKTAHISTYKSHDNEILPDRKDIVKRAKKMMGIPYLWGGNSTKGMDCSGFTSTVFKSEGYQLPRDANMQVKLGEEIIPQDDYSNVLPGDLVFFGSPDRITHVGISLGGSYFIHSSADVHINSLDKNDDLFNAYRKRTFRRIKRIINN
jgi:cell wall-associated NlpC family hydrolase